MVKVVYFNQWFSSITDVIEDLKNKHKNEIKVIASSRNENHAYKDIVDEFIVEDWEEVKGNIEKTKENYIEWVLNTCEKYKVDLFFVKKHAEWVAEYAYDFALRNTFLINENKEVFDLMLSKAGVYDKLSEVNSLKKFIPNYLKTSNKDEVMKLLDNLNHDNPWCFKLDSDEGGASFRRIDTDKITLNTLGWFRVNTVSLNEAKEMLEYTSDEDINKLIYMELLDSPEISVDCYRSKRGFIAICREKMSNTRIQKLYYNEEISKICDTIGKELGLRFPFNVQFRVKHKEDSTNIEKLRLLEINPRMSGGTYYSTMLGMNIADVCLCDMLNIPERYDIEKFIGFENRFVTHVEKAMEVK